MEGSTSEAEEVSRSATLTIASDDAARAWLVEYTGKARPS